MGKLKLRKGRWAERWINVEPVGLSADRGHRTSGQASTLGQNASIRNFVLLISNQTLLKTWSGIYSDA